MLFAIAIAVARVLAVAVIVHLMTHRTTARAYPWWVTVLLVAGAALTFLPVAV